MHSRSLRAVETQGSHAIALKDAIPAAWEMDVIQAGPSNLLYPQTAKQHLTRSLSRGAAIAVFTFHHHFCPWGIWMWNEIFNPIVWFICYIIQRYHLGSLKDRSSPFRTCPLGVRQPICFLPHKQGRFVWALQYVLLEGFQHAEFLSRDRADKPWGNKVVGLWNDKFARHPFLKWVNKMLLIYKLMAGQHITLSQTVSNIPVRRRWVTVAISLKYVSALVWHLLVSMKTNLNPVY